MLANIVKLRLLSHVSVLFIQELKPKLENGPLLDVSLAEDLKKMVTEGLKDRLDTDVSEYKAQIKQWNEQRTVSF